MPPPRLKTSPPTQSAGHRPPHPVRPLLHRTLRPHSRMLRPPFPQAIRHLTSLASHPRYTPCQPMLPTPRKATSHNKDLRPDQRKINSSKKRYTSHEVAAARVASPSGRTRTIKKRKGPTRWLPICQPFDQSSTLKQFNRYAESKECLSSLLRQNCLHASIQAALIAACGVLMQNTLLHALVQNRRGRAVLRGRIGVIAGSDRLTQRAQRPAQLALVRAV